MAHAQLLRARQPRADKLPICGPAAALLCLLALAAACGSDDNEQKKDAEVAQDSGPPVVQEIAYDQLVEACVRASACGIDRHPFLQECVNSYYDIQVANGRGPLYATLFSCVNSGGGDCKVIRECLGYAGKPQACDNSYTSACRDGVAYNCDLISGWEYGLDCARGGLVCGVKNTGEVGKGQAAQCGGGTCEVTTDKARCDRNRLLSCVGGSLEIKDCVAQQLQCRDPAVGACEGTGRSCPASEPICEGDVLKKCVHGYWQEVDCRQAPGRKACAPQTQSCRGNGSECSMDSDWDTCEGDSLITCIDGYRRTFDCKAMGFLGCEKAATYGAYCKAAPVYE